MTRNGIHRDMHIVMYSDSDMQSRGVGDTWQRDEGMAVGGVLQMTVNVTTYGDVTIGSDKNDNSIV